MQTARCAARCGPLPSFPGSRSYPTPPTPPTPVAVVQLGWLHPHAKGTDRGRLSIRGTMIVDPQGVIQVSMMYPTSTGVAPAECYSRRVHCLLVCACSFAWREQGGLGERGAGGAGARGTHASTARVQPVLFVLVRLVLHVSTGRNFSEVVRVLDALRVTSKFEVCAVVPSLRRMCVAMCSGP